MTKEELTTILSLRRKAYSAETGNAYDAGVIAGLEYALRQTKKLDHWSTHLHHPSDVSKAFVALMQWLRPQVAQHGDDSMWGMHMRTLCLLAHDFLEKKKSDSDESDASKIGGHNEQ
jgi:hypothetical protein